MNGWLLVVLVFSVALNVGLASAVIVHLVDTHREAPAWPAEGPFGPGPGMMNGNHAGRGPGMGRRSGGIPRPGFGRGRMAERVFAEWPEHRVERLSRALNLSPSQRDALKAELARYGEQLAALTRELADTRYATSQLLASDTVDSSAVRAGMRRGAGLQSRIDSLVAEAMFREARVLNPEQRRRFLELQWSAGGP